MSPDLEGVERRLRALVRGAKTPGLQYVAVDRSGVLFQCHDAEVAARRPMTGDTTMMAYLEKYSAMNLVKRWLINRELTGTYSGRWLRIASHYVDGPAYGGLVGNAVGFGRFLQDLLREHSRLFGDETRASLGCQ